MGARKTAMLAVHESQGSSAEVKATIHKAFAVCESQIVRLGGKLPTL
jgi:hypothetical protein